MQDKLGAFIDFVLYACFMIIIIGFLYIVLGATYVILQGSGS